MASKPPGWRGLELRLRKEATDDVIVNVFLIAAVKEQFDVLV